MPNPGNPDRSAPRPDTARRLWRGSVALVAPLALLALMAFSMPAAAQSTAETASPAPAAPVHQASRKSASDSADKTAAKAGSSSDSSSPTDDGTGFGGLTSSKGPINIRSDTLSLDYKGKKVLFTGHVHAVQQNSELTSDTLHVNYEQNFKDVKDMTADGNVRISQGARWATSDHAVMNQKIQTVVLTGNPVVHDGTDIITGDRITVHLDTGKSVVEHAHALIFPRQSQTPDNGASASASTAGQSAAEDASAPGAGADNSAGAPGEASGH